MVIASSESTGPAGASSGASVVVVVAPFLSFTPRASGNGFVGSPLCDAHVFASFRSASSAAAATWAAVSGLGLRSTVLATIPPISTKTATMMISFFLLLGVSASPSSPSAAPPFSEASLFFFAISDLRVATGHDAQRRATTGRVFQEMRQGDDRRLRLAHPRDELVDALAHDVLRTVDQCDDGVGRRLDALDQIGVQRERRTIQSRNSDHRSILGPRGWPSQALTDLSAAQESR